jgi:hypothetical protein
MTAPDPADRPDAATCAKLLAAIEPGSIRPLRVPLTRRARSRCAGFATLAVAAALLFVSAPTPTTGAPLNAPRQGAVTNTVVSPEPEVTQEPRKDKPAKNKGQRRR